MFASKIVDKVYQGNRSVLFRPGKKLREAVVNQRGQGRAAETDKAGFEKIPVQIAGSKKRRRPKQVNKGSFPVASVKSRIGKNIGTGRRSGSPF